MKILPMVLHKGHIPVVTFFGPVLIIFWVFLRPINRKKTGDSIKLSFYSVMISTRSLNIKIELQYIVNSNTH